MPAPAWEDLGAFLRLQDFAVSAQHRPGGNGLPRSVVGIFDDPVDSSSLVGRGSRRRSEFEIETAVPTFRLRATDAAGIQRLDTLTVDGRVWDVVAVDTDGAGMATVQLGARHD
ncbi:MAG: hypothetical protein KGZ52_02640 [Xanthomonadaceae bacterium]|nr:hypothetical protein [Xanthomonadaceae bacterium]